MSDEKNDVDLEKELFFKKVKKEKITINSLAIISFVLLICFLSFVFRKVINEYNLSNIISLGAILSTFGAALLAIAQVIEKDRYDRILRNVDIYYKDIVKEKPWRRWQFLKRTSKSKINDSIVITTTLQNPEITFEVGSDEIKVYLPTVLEDFYDLPAFDCYFKMARNTNHYLNNDTGTKIDMEGSQGYMRWYCLYDIWESVILFRISRYITKTGIIIIISSIMFTVYYSLLF